MRWRPRGSTAADLRPTRVFVLCTGRCGSMTFSRACAHLTNFTAGHETRSMRSGDDRFAYPESHIEIDNRLSWMLGELAGRFEPERTLYVHLTRDREEVARSFVKRWDPRSPSGIIRAFAQAIVQRRADWPEEDRLELCRFYVDVVTNNITEFLRHRPRTARVRLEHVEEDFPALLRMIGAEGDLAAAMAEWQTTHNASKRIP